MQTNLAETQVVMIRHAQSQWNLEGRFTGWADPPLTAAGRAEAVAAGRAMAAAGYRFDLAYTSRLQRARATAELVLQHSENGTIPLIADWRLNERHYGALQGLDKARMTDQVGETQVWRWRRGYRDRPPGLPMGDPRHPARQGAWRDIPADALPNGESLAETRIRVRRFWREVMVAALASKQRILIASHGNTLRALLMDLGKMREAEVEGFEIPTGVPILYRFDAQGRPLGWQYLESRWQAA